MRCTLAVLAISLAAIIPAVAASCESLASLSLPDATITKAESVPMGQNSSAGHCRVTATLKPSSDSDIKIEVWMPASGWNGKYQAVGNAGWSGSIAVNAMQAAIKDGYATSSTDTGHEGGSASFALGHPEKLIDYAYLWSSGWSRARLPRRSSRRRRMVNERARSVLIRRSGSTRAAGVSTTLPTLRARGLDWTEMHPHRGQFNESATRSTRISSDRPTVHLFS